MTVAYGSKHSCSKKVESLSESDRCWGWGIATVRPVSVVARIAAARADLEENRIKQWSNMMLSLCSTCYIFAFAKCLHYLIKAKCSQLTSINTTECIGTGYKLLPPKVKHKMGQAIVMQLFKNKVQYLLVFPNHMHENYGIHWVTFPKFTSIIYSI